MGKSTVAAGKWMKRALESEASHIAEVKILDGIIDGHLETIKAIGDIYERKSSTLSSSWQVKYNKGWNACRNKVKAIINGGDV